MTLSPKRKTETKSQAISKCQLSKHNSSPRLLTYLKTNKIQGEKIKGK